MRFQNVTSIRRAIVRTAELLLLFVCAGTASHVFGQNVTSVTNVFQNHYTNGYSFGPNNCPSGRTVDSSQYASSPTYGALHLERGHYMHHIDPKNSDNDYWVFWAHLDSSNYALAEAAVFKSKNECGPYLLQSQTGNPYSIDGSGYGFQPGGWQFRDDNIFRDSLTQTYNADGSVLTYADAYLMAASNSKNSVPSPSGSTCSYANDSLAIFKMTPDYLGVDASTNTATNGANWAFVCGQREAPVMFRQGSKYFLVTSQAAGWYPSQGGYGVSSNPLTGWTPSALNLGNTSTYGGQTSDGFSVEGTQTTSYYLLFDHLGGDDSKSPATNERRDSGNFILPVLLNGAAGTATLPWSPSFSVDNTTGVLTLPTLVNLASGGTATATIASAASSGNTTYVPANAIDGSYATRWTGSSTGTSAFAPAKSVNASVLCPVTGATSSTTCNPSLIVDIGSVQPVQQIDLSWYMVKGSEPYYTFKIAYSSNGSTWSTLDYTTFAQGALSPAMNIGSVPFSNNITYGFNSLPVNFSARFVALLETSVVQQNSTSPFYAPNTFEMAVYKSTAPSSPAAVNVTVTPANNTIGPSDSLAVTVAVAGPSGQSVPTGYVQLTAPNYTSETYGLVNGSSSFTIPAGVLPGGAGTISAAFRADPSSAPVYGVGTSNGTASVNVTAPNAPANLTVTPTSPGSLTAGWTAAPGTNSYVLYRSIAGGASNQLATTSSVTYVYSGLDTSGNVTYCYAVAAVNAAGPGTPSAQVCNTPSLNFPVSGLAVAQTGPGALMVSYSALANTTGYAIKRSVNGGAYIALTTTTATSYTDSGLAVDGTNYCYTVAAVFSTGTAADSAPACSAASTSFAPSGLQVTPWASGQLYVTWASTASGTTFAIKRSVNGSGYTVAGTASIPTYIDTGLSNDSNVYCYVVDSVLNGVSSADSAAVCSTPVSSFLSVNNFSFESPSIALWSTGPNDISNGTWTYVGSSGSNNGNNSGISATSGTWTNQNTPPTALGSQVAFLEGTGSVSQSINGFTAGRIYTVSLAASQRQTATQSGTNPIAMRINGNIIATLAPPQSTRYYRDYSATFTSAGTANLLALAGTSSSTTSAVLIDNIRITSTGSAVTQINVSPMTIAQGTASAVLNASLTYPGAAPKSGLIFQVGNGDQVAGTCSSSTGALVCSATYPTGALATGSSTVTVTYLGDTNYAAASGSGTLTVNDASSGTIQLVSSAPLTRASDGSYLANVTISNSGTTTATSVTIKSLTVGSGSATGVPAALGDIPPGGSASMVLSVPASAGNSGSATVERLSGTYTAGSFGSSTRTRLP